jgi:membrane associated rhomboid family serine protease
MIDDREYMRQPAYHEPRWSFTVALLVVNAVVFVIQLLAANSPHGSLVEYNYFALSLAGLGHGFFWQLLTFQFMHAGWLHLIFNSLAIYFFGRSVETVLGRGRFLALYFSSGILGGVVQMVFAYFFQSYDVPVVGASAGAYGLVAAFAVLNWEEQFTLLIYFFPVTMRGKTLLWVSLALVLAGLLIPNSGVANAAHLGGLLTGFFYVRQIVQGRWRRMETAPRREPLKLAAAGPARKKFWRAAAANTEELSAEEFLQKEVDPILDKISAHGMQSLTTRERETLEKARAKMTRR